MFLKSSWFKLIIMLKKLEGYVIKIYLPSKSQSIHNNFNR